MGETGAGQEGGTPANTEQERLQAAWLEWTHSNLGRNPVRAEAAVTAAREAMDGGGRGITAAYEAARSAWGSVQAADGDASAVPATFAALAFSNMSDGSSLEGFAGLMAVGAFGLALWRSSAGYAIASGITLFLVAGGLVGFLQRLRRSG